ncbi:phosphotransferase family protein [Aspergillus aculeatinus CBS 121060]|uniref:APH-domain-containing protein n=1 Tax=Aspergillus aculeatinus CBS 121060 TaxID=1448322 RepID=A0ACD1H104_9EURO|nr:APH-domain-containing protein [Aspergillus aculeatinus CBS 121060]RAH67227.1 APH-domain-containing protein [Aspergillus aculeatinus CBS 121060]
MQLVYLVVMLGALVAAGSTDPHDQQADHSLVPNSGYLPETMDLPCTEEPNIPGPRVQTGKRSLLSVNRKRDPQVIKRDPETLYIYSAQRWLWNETQQLQRRYRAFDLPALIHIAEQAAGNNAECATISKLPEGNFNKALLVTMRDDRQLVVKIPNPNAGPAHYTTASEVATMRYARENLHLPVPQVLAYCSRAGDSQLDAEYIVMEKARGIELSRVWETLKPREKLSIVQQLGSITSRLSSGRFPAHGSLYLREDVAESEALARAEVDIHRGPWPSTKDTIHALIQREQACIHHLPSFPRDHHQGIFNGPGGYHPTKQTKLSVLQDLLSIYHHLLPKDEALNQGILWHNDLHLDNIFVSHDHPTEITGIIDWQAVPIYPMFLIAHHPSLIEYDGLKPERFVQPRLPENIHDLSPADKKAAGEMYLAQTLWLYYETQIYKEAPDLLHAFKYCETVQSDLLGLVGSIFDDGEPHVQKLLATVATDEVWKQLVGMDDRGDPVMACPLKYNEQDLVRQAEEYARWEGDVERKARVIEELGVYPGWDGAVPPDDYDEMARRLEVAKKRFLDRESRTPEERRVWKKAWPFEDKAE